MLLSTPEYHRILRKRERRIGRKASLEEEISIEEQDNSKRNADIYGTASVIGTLASVTGSILSIFTITNSFWGGVGYISGSILVYAFSHLAANKAIELESKGYNSHQNL